MHCSYLLSVISNPVGHSYATSVRLVNYSQYKLYFRLTSALLDPHPVSSFLDPRSLLISCSPTEPYPSLHHVFGMTYHLNSAPFLYLHHRHCQLPITRHPLTLSVTPGHSTQI